MKKLFLLAPLVMWALCACNNDIENIAPVQRELTLTASVGATVPSRTNFTSTGDFFWTKGDKIMVYSTNGTFSPFKVISGAGTSSATFSGTITGSTSTCAVYPAEAAKSVSGSSLTFVAPSSYEYDYEQTDFATIMTPTINSTNIPMMAKIATTGSTNLNFKNLGGVFCFKFKDVPANTSKIVFTANSQICGTFTVDISADVPTINTASTNKKSLRSISVIFEPSDIKTDRVVYFPVPCGTYEGFEIEMFDDDDNTTAYIGSQKTKVVARSAALIFKNVTVTTLSGGIESENASSNIINGHEYVDLGLPSGLKWATCNIGAENPSDYGDFFAWGETLSKDKFKTEDNKWSNMAYSSLESQGVIDSNGNLTAQYDAATSNWGTSWRIPTYDELLELQEKCTWIWTKQENHMGYSVTGPNGISMFLPAAGFVDNTSLQYVGTCCHIGGATTYNNQQCGNHCAYILYISQTGTPVALGVFNRAYGRQVRPVSD